MDPIPWRCDQANDYGQSLDNTADAPVLLGTRENPGGFDGYA